MEVSALKAVRWESCSLWNNPGPEFGIARPVSWSMLAKGFGRVMLSVYMVCQRTVIKLIEHQVFTSKPEGVSVD